MSRRLGLGFATLVLIGLVVGVFVYAPQLIPLQGGSDCDQDPECEVLPPSDSGDYEAPGPISEFCIKTGQELICFGPGDNNSGHELAHCWDVTVTGSHVSWSRNEDSSTCQDPSHFQVWWQPGDTPTPTSTATHTSEPPTSTPTETETPVTPSATATNTPTGTEEPTETPSPTATDTATPTETQPTATGTVPTPTKTATVTQTATETPSPTASASSTVTQTPTPTETLRPGEPSRTPEPPPSEVPPQASKSPEPQKSPVPSSTPGVGDPPPPSGGGIPWVLPGLGLLLLAALLGGVLALGLRKHSAE